MHQELTRMQRCYFCTNRLQKTKRFETTGKQNQSPGSVWVLTGQCYPWFRFPLARILDPQPPRIFQFYTGPEQQWPEHLGMCLGVGERWWVLGGNTGGRHTQSERPPKESLLWAFPEGRQYANFNHIRLFFSLPNPTEAMDDRQKAKRGPGSSLVLSWTACTPNLTTFKSFSSFIKWEPWPWTALNSFFSYNLLNPRCNFSPYIDLHAYNMGMHKIPLISHKFICYEINFVYLKIV